MLHYLYTGITDFATKQETKEKIAYPISLSEVKRHLRIDDQFFDDDDYLETLIEVATQAAENYIDADIAETEVVVRIVGFYGDWIKIAEGNFDSIEDIYDQNDASVGNIKRVTRRQNTFQIEWRQPISPEELHIKFKTGFENGKCPASIKHAILIKIADLYDEARSDYNWNGMQNNRVFEDLLNPYKMIR